MERCKGMVIRALSIVIVLGFVLVAPFGILASTANVLSKPVSREGAGQVAPMGASDYPMFRYQASRNGVTGTPGPSTNKLLWENTSSGALYSSPAVADGRVFFGSDDGSVYAFDAITGKQLWKNTTAAGDYGASSSPAVSNGNVFIYSNADDDLYCFNASTGERKWKTDLGSGGYGGSSPVVIGGKVYVGSSDGRMYVRNENDGSASWNFQIGASGANGYGVESGPAVVGTTVYFGGGDDKVRAVNITTHNLVWSYPLGQRGYPSPAVVGNVVYTADGVYNVDGCASCKIYALDIDGFTDGNDGWAGEAATGATDGDVIWQKAMTDMTMSSPTIYKGYLFIGSRDNRVYGLNATNGNTVWSFNTGSDVFSSPTIASDMVYIASANGKVYAFDYDGFADGNDGWAGEAATGGTDGDIIWNYTIGSQMWASPAISNGVLYITDLGGGITAIGVPSVNTTPPKVLSTNPKALQTNVPVTTNVTAHFDEDLLPVSVDDVNFTLKDDAAAVVPGTVTYDAPNHNITLDPAADLDAHKLYTATIKNIKDAAGNTMSAQYSWNFSTTNQKPVLSNGAVNPATGNLTTSFQFSVIYTDPDDDAPVGGVKVFLNGGTGGKVMVLNLTATPAALHDGSFANGEAYVYNTTFAIGGDNTFQFKATDGLIENVTQVFNGPHVETPNLPPVISAVPEQHPVEDVAFTFDLGPYVSDPDNSTDELLMSVSSQYITGTQGFNATFLFPHMGATPVDVLFNITDGVNQAQRTVRFVITDVDHPPTMTPIADVTVNATEAYIIDLGPKITDTDTSLSSIIVSTNSSYITINKLNLTLNYPRTVTGETVNVSVKDAKTTIYDEFVVTVYAAPLNKAPVISALPDALATEDEVLSYDLTTRISDDGLPSGILNISIKPASPYVTVQGMVLKMLYPNGVLTDTLNITASDGELNTTTVLKVTVTPVNDPPILTNGKMTENKPANKKDPTEYVFTVTCTDIDSSSPTVEVMIDNVSYPMTVVGGNIKTGLNLEFRTNNKALDKGMHVFKFVVDDKSGAANAKAETAQSTFNVVRPKKDSGNNIMGGMMLPILLIVVVVVVLVVVAAVMMRRKKGQAQQPAPAPMTPVQTDMISRGQPPSPPVAAPTTLPPPEQPVPQPQAQAPDPQVQSQAPLPEQPPAVQPGPEQLPAPPPTQPPQPPTN